MQGWVALLGRARAGSGGRRQLHTLKLIMVELKRIREWLDWMKPMPPMSACHKGSKRTQPTASSKGASLVAVHAKQKVAARPTRSQWRDGGAPQG